MNTRNIIWFCLPLAALLGLAVTPASAQLPANFPTLVITSNGPVAPGDIIGTMGAKGNATNNYNVVLDNSGTPIYWTPFTNLWRAVAPCGLIAESASTGWLMRDETFSVVDTFPKGDGHDFKLLPNGHALLLGNEDVPVDMSQYVADGRPDAVLKSLTFQELDANKQVIFNWRAIDHLPITDSLDFLNIASVDWTHFNALTIDPLDNNYLLSLRGFCQIVKVSRTNGAVIWRLGGIHSDFTFIGEHPENAPYYFIGQHNVHRLANGDIMFFDNGSLQNQGALAGRTYSRAVEYRLDETNMTATLVWEYRHSPDVLNPTEGIVKRFPNGNTYVGWVSAAQNGSGPVFTEVNASNQVMFELSLPGFRSQTIMTKQVWNSPDLVHSDTNLTIVAGQTYNDTNAGVAVTVNSLTGSGDQLIVSKHDDAARFPRFSGQDPQVLIQRVTLSGTGIDALAADLTFDLPPNDYVWDTPLYHDPSNLVIYQRPTVGQGLFTPLPTVYDSVANKLKASTTNLGEFIFAYADQPEIPLAPILYGQGIEPSVSQTEPVVLQWTPKGIARSYHLQAAADSGFSSLFLDQNGLTNMTYTLTNVPPGANYWRVNVSNLGGTSDWSTASFSADPPMIQVASPAGGEAWRRGLPYFIRWTNNLAENVAIKLYKGGTPITTLNTNAANLGAYYWSINYTNVPATNYSIRISSATNSAVFGVSALPFSIVDPPTFNSGSVVVLTNGNVQFGLTAPGAATAKVWVSTDLITWQVLQSVPVVNGSAVITDNTATNSTARFYRLSLP